MEPWWDEKRIIDCVQTSGYLHRFSLGYVWCEPQAPWPPGTIQPSSHYIVTTITHPLVPLWPHQDPEHLQEGDFLFYQRGDLRVPWIESKEGEDVPSGWIFGKGTKYHSSYPQGKPAVFSSPQDTQGWSYNPEDRIGQTLRIIHKDFVREASLQAMWDGTPPQQPPDDEPKKKKLGYSLTQLIGRL